MKDFYSLIKTLRITASTNEKIEYIKDFFNNSYSREFFLLETYADPERVFYFSKKQIANSLKENYTAGLFDKKIDMLVLLDKFASRELSGKAAERAYGLFVNTATEEEIEVLNTILTNSPIGANVKIINKAYRSLFDEDFIDIFNCQLANKYEPKKNYKVSHWYISPKLDGLRCVFRNDKLFTRQNKPIIGFDFLEEELRTISKKLNLDIIDGELYSHEIDFHTIQGIVTRNKNIDEEKKRQIKLNVFGVTGPNINHTGAMICAMRQMESNNELKNVEVVKNEFIDNNEEVIKKFAKEFVSQGYEGAMLRHPDNHYVFKRSNDLLKVKFFLEDDFVITGSFEGENKYEGMLGGLFVESLDGKIKSKVGSGFSDKQRKEFKNKDLTGIKAEIKYFEITPDNSLRFPVFLKLKEDR